MKTMEKLKRTVEKAVAWFAESGRQKHVAVGLVIGAVSFHVWTGIYGAVAAGLAAEYKDREWGGKCDMTDLLCTVCGGIVGSMIWM